MTAGSFAQRAKKSTALPWRCVWRCRVRERKKRFWHVWRWKCYVNLFRVAAASFWCIHWDHRLIARAALDITDRRSPLCGNHILYPASDKLYRGNWKRSFDKLFFYRPLSANFMAKLAIFLSARKRPIHTSFLGPLINARLCGRAGLECHVPSNDTRGMPYSETANKF